MTIIERVDGGRTEERVDTTLAGRFDPRSNSLDLLRLGLATLVAVVHASAIFVGHQPTVKGTEIGALAVDGFFVLSGFLVARSFERLSSPVRYLWHRFLRIMPLFWVMLLLTAGVVAPILAVFEGRSADSVFFGADPAWRYVTDNALLYIAPDRFGVAGLPSGTEQPGVVNGALWTLFYEAVCYALVGVLGVTGLLRRRSRWLCAATGVLWLAVVAQEVGVELPGDLFLRFFLVFMLGTLAYVHADRVPIDGRLALVSLAVLVASMLLFDDYRVLGALAFAYLCMWAVVATPFLRHRPRWDLSYGMYVFHWPIETMLVTSGAAGAAGLAGYTGLAVVLAATAAAVSWNVIEKPALSLKDAPLPFDGQDADRWRS